MAMKMGWGGRMMTVNFVDSSPCFCAMPLINATQTTLVSQWYFCFKKVLSNRNSPQNCFSDDGDDLCDYSDRGLRELCCAAVALIDSIVPLFINQKPDPLFPYQFHPWFSIQWQIVHYCGTFCNLDLVPKCVKHVLSNVKLARVDCDV